MAIQIMVIPAIAAGVKYAGRWLMKYNKKFNDNSNPLAYGGLYAGGTVLGYHGFSQFFKPKWKYLGSPQRISKL